MWVIVDITHVDARGRIVLPASLRARLDLKEGTALVIEVDPDGSLHLTTRAAKARRLLGIAAEPGAMEDFWAMRREERDKEVEFLRRHGAAPITPSEQ